MMCGSDSMFIIHIQVEDWKISAYVKNELYSPP